ncbi:MAG: hypothetical protein FWB79_01655 [Treponema sp.]|nr:hypothetical protein [Treponema sp.]
MTVRYGYNDKGDNFLEIEQLIAMFETTPGTIEIRKGEARDLALLLNRLYEENKMFRKKDTHVRIKS